MTYRPPSFPTLIGVGVVALAASLVMTFSRPVELTVDGAHVLSDVPPVTGAAGHVYVPLRPVADALGARTSVPQHGNVNVERGRHSLQVSVGDRHARINGHAVLLDHAPFRVRGRVMVELNAVAHAFSVRTRYDSRGGKVALASPGVGQAFLNGNTTALTQ